MSEVWDELANKYLLRHKVSSHKVASISNVTPEDIFFVHHNLHIHRKGISGDS